MTKHTGLTVELYANCPPEILDDRGDLVATVHYGGGRSEVEVHANARLFAAAPQLLQACKDWVAYFDNLERNSDPGDTLAKARRMYHGPRVEQTRDAIASAEGRNP